MADPETITLNGETLRRVLPAWPNSVEYRSENATVYRSAITGHWFGWWYPLHGYTGHCLSLDQVVSELTVRESWRRRFWRWVRG